MDIVGLEPVKRKFIQINTLIQTANRQELDISEAFGAVFIGNPGTGKSKVAKIYANFLYATDIVPDNSLTVVTGARLVSGGVQVCGSRLDNLETTGGVFLVEEAHQMVSKDGGSGGSVIDYLLSEVEKLKGRVVFLFAGHGKQMETFCVYNAAFPSLIPTSINFPDYFDHELHLLLVYEAKRRFKQNVNVEGGYYGPLMRIVARRIGRGRGRQGFGNIRQADRLFRVFTSSAWEELKGMIGLKSVKDSIEAIIHRLQLNYKREIAEMPLFECSLNKLFLGNPGTGKTTVAKLYYGQILADIGLLSNGEVIIKTPSELIEDALGQSKRNTKAILDSTKGKVLIIDEAYMLGSRNKSASTTDAFRAGAIDTIVGEIQSTAVEDRCVLLVGYRDRMESMLNEGEIEEILNVKLGSQGLKASNEAKTTAIEVLSRSRNRPGFGNAGEVDILSDQAKLRQNRRLLVSSDGSAETDLLLPSDFDPDFERGSRSLLDIKLLFEDFLQHYQLVVRNMKAVSKRVLDGTVMIPLKDPREMIPFTFLFCGPPGTGKTTKANRMGKVFYDMGFLAAKDVIECSATDLIGEYVGHTGPKTKRIFDTSLGRVLFIDEASKLAEGPYGKEAMVEIVNNLAKDNYRNKLVVILAGYERDINKLMSVSTGLNSRFPVVVRFKPLSMMQCSDLFFKSLRNYGLETQLLEESGHLKQKRETVAPDIGDGKMASDPTARHDSHEALMIPPTTTSTKANTNTKKTTIENSSPNELHDINPVTNIVHEEKFSAVTESASGDGSPRGAERDPGVPDEIWNQLQYDKAAAKKRQMNYDNSRNILARVTKDIANAQAMLSTTPAGSAIRQRAETPYCAKEAGEAAESPGGDRRRTEEGEGDPRTTER
ncbi:P-loop containing nucleoside triphosphate hydrolase protein [Ustulina deusta]|nr:P-loop containing nucleoside triphosphate hydrolase protein [Ustulina deusta]